MPDVAKYLQRISFMMRQGKPANDVALYLPNDDGWANMQPGNPHLIDVLRERIGPDLMPAIFEAGYNLDFFDDDSFKQVGRVENGSIVLGQNAYNVVILPGVETIPLDTYRKFEEFVKGGGILIATKRTPSEVPGLRAIKTDHDQITEISRRLFEGANATAHVITTEPQVGSLLNQLLPPDVGLSVPNCDIGFVHRKTEDADIYFVANTSNTKQRVNATFRVNQTVAESWSPFDGTASLARNTKGTTVGLTLEPYGSQLIVFSKSGASTDKRTLHTLATGGVLPESMDLSSNWQLKFGSGKSEVWEKLHSWTDDAATRYYSGVATYEKQIDVPTGFLSPHHSVVLNFGQGTAVPPQPLRSGMQTWLDGPIREAAVVYINDKRVGAVWCPPYEIDVTKFLNAGPNRIRIEVANTAMNYMAGHSLPDYRLLNLRYGERFQAQDMDKIQALPSGMLGPVRLIASMR